MKAIVGFLDILGYESFLENNEPEEVANIIKEVLPNCAKTVSGHLAPLIGGILSEKLPEGIEKNNFMSAVKSVESCIFSDTILLYAESVIMDKEDAKKKMGPLGIEQGHLVNFLQWAYFADFCSELFSYMLLKGLPLRGAISYGDVLVSDNCFAGRPIVDAYKFSKEIKFAGIAFCDSTESFIDDLIWKADKGDANRGSDIYFNKILAPFVNHPDIDSTREGRFRVINFLSHGHFMSEAGGQKVSDVVLDSFSAHKKDIGDMKVLEKIENTIKQFTILEELNKEYKEARAKLASLADK